MLRNLLSFLHEQFKALYILLAETRSEYYTVLPNKNTLICSVMWLKSLSHFFCLPTFTSTKEAISQQNCSFMTVGEQQNLIYHKLLFLVSLLDLPIICSIALPIFRSICFSYILNAVSWVASFHKVLQAQRHKA